MNEERIHKSIERLHDKIDKLTDEITDFKVAVATLPCKGHNIRLRIVEMAIYGFFSLLAIAFMATLSGDKAKTSTAKQIKDSVIISKKAK